MSLEVVVIVALAQYSKLAVVVVAIVVRFLLANLYRAY